VRLWDTDTGQEVLTLPWPEVRITALGFRPDGRQLAAASVSGVVRERTVCLWEAVPRGPD